MKSLYDKNHRYEPIGMTLDSQATEAIKPIFDRFVEYGFSPREISHMIQSAVDMLELEAVMDKKQEVVK